MITTSNLLANWEVQLLSTGAFKGSLCIFTGSLSISVHILAILIPSRIFKVRKFLKRPETFTVNKINQISGKPQQLGVKIKSLADLRSKYQGISAKCRTHMCLGTCMQRFSHPEIPNYLFDNIFLYRITLVIYRLMFPITGIQSLEPASSILYSSALILL